MYESGSALWVERNNTVIKSRTVGKTSSGPEKCMLAYVMETDALDRMHMHRPNLQGMQARCTTSNRSDEEDEHAYLWDSRQGSTGGMLLGKGRPAAAMSDAVQAAITDNIDRLMGADLIDGWSVADLDNAAVYVHEVADLREGERVDSTSYSRVRTRETCHVRVTYVSREGNPTPYVARVKYYVRLVREDGEVLRYALCDIFKYLQPYDDDDFGYMLRAKEYLSPAGCVDEAFCNTNYFVDLSTIDCQLLRATDWGKCLQERVRVADGDVVVTARMSYFLEYQFKSGLPLSHVK